MMTVALPQLDDLETGARFLSCIVDPAWVAAHTDVTRSRMGETGETATLADLDDVADDDLLITVGFINSGLPLSEVQPCGDEFLSSIRLVENELGKRINGLVPLAAANINAVVPVLLSMELGVPIIDADPQGRVFPLVHQTSFALAAVPVRYAAVTGPTGESALIKVNHPLRAERLLRAMATELGGWAATALFPMTARTLKTAGLRGTMSRVMHIGNILNRHTSTERKLQALRVSESVFRIIRARVSDTSGMARPPEPGKPGVPSTVILTDLEHERIIELEIYNEIVMVLVDGVIAAVMPDITSLISSTTGEVADIDDLWVGNILDIVMLRGSERWYRPDGLALAAQLAHRVPIGAPRR